MNENLTDRARKVMQLANQEARRFNVEYIGTEHILLGLVKEGSGVAATVLKNLDIDLRKIRLEVEKIVQSPPDTVTMGRMTPTAPAKKVIDYSIEEARNLNHNYVGTEHLLLGLLREQEGVAAHVLMNLRLKREVVRKEVLNVLGVTASDRDDAIRQADLSRSQKPSKAPEPFPLFPEEAKRALTEVHARIEKLVRKKEDAIVEQDFEKAAWLRDKAYGIQRQVLDVIKKLQALLGESENDSK